MAKEYEVKCPYWDVLLVESLPSPVIELPKVAAEQSAFGMVDLFENVVSGKNKSKRR